MKSEIRNQKSGVRGFTLVELMVTIGIIAMLVGLTIGVTTAVSANADRREAETTLNLMSMANDQWERLSERQISYGYTFVKAKGTMKKGTTYEIDQTAYEWKKDKEKADLPKIYLSYILHNAQSAATIAKISDRHVKKNADGLTYVVDPWDTTIRVIFPGRKWDAAFEPPDSPANRDIDGTIRTVEETVFGICVDGRINFVSYGPDGKPGSLQLDKSPDERDPRQVMDRADNIFAYPPLEEKPVMP